MMNLSEFGTIPAWLSCTQLMVSQFTHAFACAVAVDMVGEAVSSSSHLAVCLLSLAFFHYAAKNALLGIIRLNLVFAAKVQQYAVKQSLLHLFRRTSARLLCSSFLVSASMGNLVPVFCHLSTSIGFCLSASCPIVLFVNLVGRLHHCFFLVLLHSLGDLTSNGYQAVCCIFYILLAWILGFLFLSRNLWRRYRFSPIWNNSCRWRTFIFLLIALLFSCEVACDSGTDCGCNHTDELPTFFF